MRRQGQSFSLLLQNEEKNGRIAFGAEHLREGQEKNTLGNPGEKK
jgi:hypothetical protein